MIKLNQEDFCCNAMYSHLIGPDGDGCEIHLNYTPNTREFSIPYKSKRGGGVQLISHCPWCGFRLPKTLRDKLFHTVEKDCGIKTNILTFKTDKRIPPEF